MPASPEDRTPVAGPGAPLLFLDIDDVLALNTHYGGREAQRAIFRPEKAPPDIYEKLFSRAAVDALNQLILECKPRIVLTTSWLLLLDRNCFLELFEKTSVHIGMSNLHPAWDAPQMYGLGRGAAIASWLSKHHRGEPVLILDDECSGATLVDTPWMRAGHVVLCAENVGFHSGLLDAARKALCTEFSLSSHWRPWVRRD